MGPLLLTGSSYSALHQSNPTNSLPAAAKFLPTEDELVGYYLYNYIRNKLPPLERSLVPERDLFGEHEPWELWRDLQIEGLSEPSIDVYVFTTLQIKAQNSSRKVGKGQGSWHGEDKPQFRDAGEEGSRWVSRRRRFKYVDEKSRGKPGSEDGNWALHEFSLSDDGGTSFFQTVVCILRNKKLLAERRASAGGRKRKLAIPSSEDIRNQPEPQVLGFAVKRLHRYSPDSVLEKQSNSDQGSDFFPVRNHWETTPYFDKYCSSGWETASWHSDQALVDNHIETTPLFDEYCDVSSGLLETASLNSDPTGNHMETTPFFGGCHYTNSGLLESVILPFGPAQPEYETASFYSSPASIHMETTPFYDERRDVSGLLESVILPFITAGRKRETASSGIVPSVPAEIHQETTPFQDNTDVSDLEFEGISITFTMEEILGSSELEPTDVNKSNETGNVNHSSAKANEEEEQQRNRKASEEEPNHGPISDTVIGYTDRPSMLEAAKEVGAINNVDLNSNANEEEEDLDTLLQRMIDDDTEQFTTLEEAVELLPSSPWLTRSSDRDDRQPAVAANKENVVQDDATDTENSGREGVSEAIHGDDDSNHDCGVASDMLRKSWYEWLLVPEEPVEVNSYNSTSLWDWDDCYGPSLCCGQLI